MNGGIHTRTLGLDIGDRWIGIALSDPGNILASPLSIIERTTEERDVAAITDIIRQHQVAKVIVGLPVSMDGKIREQAEKVKTFVRSISTAINLPVEFRDERLSTKTARRLMQESGHKKSSRNKRDDANAAAVILQGYLDEQRL
jgi:putative Holliday junction resolvase